MILGYSFLGLVLSSLGGIAPGASNLAVIKTSTKESIRKGMQIAIGAGAGEVLLAFMALCYSSIFRHFFEMNAWVQVSFMILLFVAGILFVFSNRLRFLAIPKAPRRNTNSKFITGFFLAFLNPPVLLFWMFGISFSQKYLLPLTNMSPTFLLMVFFTGVFFGKIVVLYLYALLGKGLKSKKNTDNAKLNRIIGFALVVLSAAQGIRFLIQ